MSLSDTCVSIVPYFKVNDGKMEDFKALCEQFVNKTQQEEGCIYYGFCFDGDSVHCREGYANAAAALAHLDNVGALIEQALQISSLERFEIHGNEEELSQLRAPLAALSPQFYTLLLGFRN